MAYARQLAWARLTGAGSTRVPFAVDTNVYIAAFEDPLSLERFGTFALTHDTLVSSVVIAELLLGPCARMRAAK